MSEENYYEKFKSSMPPHLSPEEREEWITEMEWERKELERRKGEGQYGSQGNFFQRVIRSIKGK